MLCRVRFHSPRNLLQQLLWPDFAYYIVVGCFVGWLHGFVLFSFLWYSKFLLKFLLHFELKYESPTPFQFSSFHLFPNALLIYMHTFLFTLSSYIFIINWLIKYFIVQARHQSIKTLLSRDIDRDLWKALEITPYPGYCGTLYYVEIKDPIMFWLFNQPQVNIAVI